MKYIDLHTHSNASDGTLTPAQLVRLAARRRLAAVALTDHDTVNGVEEAIDTARQEKLPIQVIPGTEITTAYKSDKTHSIHILGLCLDYHNEAFRQAADQIVQRRVQRNREMAERFQKAGIPVTMEALTAGAPNTVVTRAHFARVLIEQHIVKNADEAFRLYLNPSTPYYVPRKHILPEEGVSLILQAGGLPILAHPFQYKLEQKELEGLLRRLKEAGLIGLETMHSSYTREDEKSARELADRYGLLYSGGSDFHGSNKPAIELGSGKGNMKIPYSFLEKLAAVRDYPLY